MNLPLLAARARLYQSGPTGASIEYVRDNALDTRHLFRASGAYAVAFVDIDGDRFDFAGSKESTPAVVIEVAGSDGHSVIDLLAWPISKPSAFVTMFGRAEILGGRNLFAAATYAFDTPLICYRTPLAWWKAGCTGAVVIKPASAARLLLDAPGTISGEDHAHSVEIAELVRGLFNPARFVTPLSDLGRAA
ncbi:MAG: hypothetical protein KAG89_12250 [Fulvimarina manganoxydans]|uniref:hypothetical protein n=1 Tax=Fulvimarina manganoxydans TaxID=937218 RepID=UPI002354B12B|nr:hypothetical protein [Fulvimarina manganoxydans]MCK5932930.1 hypothetical protein [Fulvimarina manganoxydans]